MMCAQGVRAQLRTYIFFVCVTLSICLSSPIAYGQLHTSSPNIVGNADNDGFVRIDRNIYSLDLGNGARAELYLMFHTNPEREASYLGAYWSLPFFDTRLIQRSETQWFWEPPNKGGYIFVRDFDNAPIRGWDERWVLRGSKSWILLLKKSGEAQIQSASNPKVHYDFKDGRLIGFCANDGGDTFKLRYNSKGYPQDLLNLTKRMTILDFEYDGNLLKKIRINKDSAISVDYALSEAMSIDGKRKNKDIRLSSIKRISYLDGKVEEYECLYAGPKERGLMNLDRKFLKTPVLPINRLNFKSASGTESWLEWCAQTGLITSDGGGEYFTRNPYYDKYNIEELERKTIELERKRNRGSSNRSVVYKRNDKPYPEEYSYNRRTVTLLMQDPNTGKLTRTYYIGAPGASYMKARREETKLPKEKDWKNTFTRFFDDKGKLIREIDSTGKMLEYVYTGDKNNGSVKTIIDGVETNFKEFENGVTVREKRLIGTDLYESFLDKKSNKTTVTKNGEKVALY